jgi:hypothetical protein
VLAIFTVLTVGMTWPQGAHIATHAVGHHDVYFNMWRLAWIAHALASSPSSLFDGNIFYPERNTLAFSDAMFVEGLLAAPLLWAGVPPVLVHNLLLLAALIGSAFGMYALTERLTASRAAAVIAGIIFTFAPYRFEHYMHMELQWTVWMPWALLAVHRTIESGRWLHGIQAGGLLALQMLSSIYYGIFLATLLPLVSGLLLLDVKGSRAFRATRALALGGGVAAIVCGLYAIPYLSTKQQLGGRSLQEIIRYSARPADYMAATPDNRIYGRLFKGWPERRLFPGALPLVLALSACLLRRPARSTVIYVIAMTLAFEMSLGFYGYTFPFLHEHVPVFDGLRAPARLGIFVVMFLAVVAAHGFVALRNAVPTAGRHALAVLIPSFLLLEYSVVPLHLVPYDNSPPPVYQLLARLPPGVVAEFPMPRPDTLPGSEARHTYMSTFHWKPLVNGYSGYQPDSYLERLARLRGFPDTHSLNVLSRTGVTYLLVHLSSYGEPETRKLLLDLQAARGVAVLGKLNDGIGPAIIYRLE